MAIHAMQPSFTGGEFAPSLYYRTDLQKYATGCKTLKNFIVHPHGGASNRPGLEFINEIKDSTKKARLTPFEFSIEQAYVIEFGNKYCRFYMNGGQIVSGGNPYEIQTPYSEADLPLLKYTQSADVLYLVHPNYPPKTLTRTGHTNWTLADFDFKYGPYMRYNAGTTTITLSATSGDVTLTASAALFNSGHVGSWWKVRNGNIKITAVSSSTSATGTVYGDEVSEIAATDEWAEGAWSTYRGWPSCVMFCQDRLVFASTKTDPHGWWMSETGNYTSFIRHTDLEDTDGISGYLTSRKVNAIRNIVDLGDMLALTEGSEWHIGPGSGDGIIKPTSIKQVCEGHSGSSTVGPVLVKNRAVYVQPMGTILQDIGYSFENDGFTGDDLTLFASHLFRGCTVVDMAYQQEPDSIIWIIRSDGKAVAMTYLREQQILGCTPQETDGEFESVCTIPGDGYNEVWFIVKRGDKRYIERLPQRLPSTDPADCTFMDSWLKYEGEAATTISGLDHLEGKEVAVLADGFVIKGLTVENGAIALTNAAEKVIIGLPYVCDFETLNVDFNTDQGTIQSKNIKISKVTFIFENTRGGYIGPNFENTTELIQRSTQPSGTPIDLYSGDYEQYLDSGYSKGGRVCYRQVDPLPVTILAIIPEVTVGG